MWMIFRASPSFRGMTVGRPGFIAALERKGAKRDIAVKDAGEIARIDAVIWQISVSDDETMVLVL